MRDQPLVSIVTSAFNGGDYLVPAIRSALEQTYEKIEILIIDDGSTDGSVEAAQDTLNDPRIRWFRQPNYGKSVSLNHALREIRGEFYAIQDADDLSHPRRIERQVRGMQEHPDVAACFCGHELILGDRRLAPRFRAKDSAECRRDIDQMRMPAHDPTGVYRVSLVKQLRYEPSLRIGQGYDYILRVGEQHPMMVLGECLYSYRAHEASATRASAERRKDAVLRVIERAHERRRGRATVARAQRLGHAHQDNNLPAHFIESAVDQARIGRRFSAIRTGLECMRLHPFDPHYHKAWVLAATPLFLHRYLRRSAATA